MAFSKEPDMVCVYVNCSVPSTSDNRHDLMSKILEGDKSLNIGLWVKLLSGLLSILN